VKYTHDCTTCVPCGDYTSPRGTHVELYYCPNPKHPALSSLVARRSNEVSDYAASHPPEAFAQPYEQPEWERILIARAREQGVYIEPKPESE